MQSIHPALKRPISECDDASAKKPKLAGTGHLYVAANRRRQTLPSENLGEVIAFLKLFDLGAVLLANRRLSTLAEKALKRIAVTNVHCLVLRTAKHRPGFLVMAALATEKTPFKDIELLQIPTELLAGALENCVIEIIALHCEDCEESPNSPKCVVHAFRRAFGTTAITRSARFQASCFATTRDLLDFVSRFRKISTVFIDDDDKLDRKALEEFARQNDACDVEILMPQKND